MLAYLFMWYRFVFWLQRLISVLNIAAKRRADRAAELSVLHSMVSEVCGVIRSQNALAEAQVKLMTSWFASISSDPTPGRSITFSENTQLEQFAAENEVPVSSLKQYF